MSWSCFLHAMHAVQVVYRYFAKLLAAAGEFMIMAWGKQTVMLSCSLLQASSQSWLARRWRWCLGGGTGPARTAWSPRRQRATLSCSTCACAGTPCWTARACATRHTCPACG